MTEKRKIVFLTSTRADFGKIKSLIEVASKSNDFEVHIFVTGMHMNPKYGSSYDEIIKCGYENVFLCSNHNDFDPMDIILSKTIDGFSQYVSHIKPDLIVVHGDRVEPLAGAIVGALNLILTAHIEGGELSGTVDELIRHAISKMSHIHFVSNAKAKKRLIQMGEDEKSIFTIGSPDVDIMLSRKLPSFKFVKKHYEIPFSRYSILLFHSVVTEASETQIQVKKLVDAILESRLNYIVINPNNDKGSEHIFSEYERFKNNKKIKVYPSIRFENFLVLMKHARFIIGNSSSGIMEAPYYKVPTINIGTRQNKRLVSRDIINTNYESATILRAIAKAQKVKLKSKRHFGKGDSNKRFLKILKSKKMWQINKQKTFKELLIQGK